MTPEEYDSYLAAQIRNDQCIPTEIPVKETVTTSEVDQKEIAYLD